MSANSPTISGGASPHQPTVGAAGRRATLPIPTEPSGDHPREAEPTILIAPAKSAPSPAPSGGPAAAATTRPAWDERSVGDGGGTVAGRPPSGRCADALFLNHAVVLLSIAAGLTTAAYVIAPPAASASWWGEWKHLGAVAVGSAVALLSGALLGVTGQHRATAANADPTGYDQIHDHLRALHARLRAFHARLPRGVALGEGVDETRWAAYLKAEAHRTLVIETLQTKGGRWVLGTGFVDLWRHLHAAEAEVYLLDSRPDVVGAALTDEMRLKDSAIANSDDILFKLRTAVRVIGGGHAQRYLTPPAAEGDIAANTTTAIGSTTTDGTGSRVASDSGGLDEAAAEIQARAVLRDIRRTITDFRDDKWEGLARARTRLIVTGACTGLTGYALLALAILGRARADLILGAAAFYLVGATVGLFNQLRRAALDQTAIEDFGFSRTRLIATPMLSGIAAVAGVLLAGLLYAVAGESRLIYQDLGDVGALSGGSATLSPDLMSAVFDVGRNPFGLLVAATFGLTPDLLVDRLQHQADRFRRDLSSTNAHGAAASGRV